MIKNQEPFVLALVVIILSSMLIAYALMSIDTLPIVSGGLGVTIGGILGLIVFKKHKKVK